MKEFHVIFHFFRYILMYFYIFVYTNISLLSLQITIDIYILKEKVPIHTNKCVCLQTENASIVCRCEVWLWPWHNKRTGCGCGNMISSDFRSLNISGETLECQTRVPKGILLVHVDWVTVLLKWLSYIFHSQLDKKKNPHLGIGMETMVEVI